MSWLKLSLACALLAAPAVFAEPAAKDKDAKKNPPTDQKSRSSAAKVTSDDDKESAVLRDLPANQVYNGVHIPNFSPTGKLLMLFDAKSAKRIDDRDIEMQDLKIEIHNNDGSTFHVEMVHSVFNLDTRILTSNTPTTIKRDDFIINGDRAEFHVKEKFGRVFGNVKMIINSGDTK
jgi:hypothetical protein